MYSINDNQPASYKRATEKTFKNVSAGEAPDRRTDYLNQEDEGHESLYSKSNPNSQGSSLQAKLNIEQLQFQQYISKLFA